MSRLFYVIDGQRVLYCTDCGQQLTVEKRSPSFNAQTGDRIEQYNYICLNPQCRDGCRWNDGHVYPGLLDIFFQGMYGDTCKRCGFVSMDF